MFLRAPERIEMTADRHTNARRKLMRRGAGGRSAIMAGLTAALMLAGCGSGSRQDVNEPAGKFPVQVTAASFPRSQRLAQHSRLVISVRNVGTKTIPNVAVTICNTTCGYPAPVGQGTSVAAFAQYLSTPGLASHSRPVWVVNRPPGRCAYSCANGGPGSDVSADANTWQSGPLKPGASATFDWGLTAVASGHFVVAWEIAAGIYGKAKAIGPDGSTPAGTFAVSVAKAPAQSYVNDAGQVVQGQ
jgi:hypothetical protein